MIRGGAEPALGVVLTYPEPPARLPPRGAMPGRARSRRPGPDAVGGALGVGFVGAGHFASAVLLPALARQDGVVLRGLCSAGGLSARTQARRHGFGYACSDYREILDDPEIDVVFIATRHHLHAAMLLEALRKGKHAFVEKPLALRRDELEEIDVLSGREPTGPRPAGPSASIAGSPRRPSRSATTSGAWRSRSRRSIASTPGTCPRTTGPRTRRSAGAGSSGEACHAIDLLTFLLGSPPVRVHAEAVATGRRCGSPATAAR